MSSCKLLPTFQRVLPPPLSGKGTSRRLNSLSLYVQAARFSKISVNIYQSTRRTSQSPKSSHQPLLEENRTYVHLTRSEIQTFVLTRLTLSISTLPCPLVSLCEPSKRSQPPTEMSTRKTSLWGLGAGGGGGDRCVGVTTLPPSCADCLQIWEPQAPGTLRACPRLCFTH
jgi:hypothetical protein